VDRQGWLTPITFSLHRNMTAINANLRKAAIVIRSLDAEAAAALLAQLSPAEAGDVREAIKLLGSVDDDERADVSAEFRRVGPLATQDPRRGVELNLSSDYSAPVAHESTSRTSARPFEFLEQARVESLVPYLAREHAQTVAVVLAYLAPARAAQLLAALPEKLQVDALDRLSVLGDTDPNSLQVLERELADWVRRQQATRIRTTQRTDTVAAILAAATQNDRSEILANLVRHNQQLAQRVAPALPQPKPEPAAAAEPAAATPPVPIVAPRLPRLHIDDLARLDRSALTAVLRAVDSQVLVLALVGASEELADRITEEMPPKVAKAFRQKLNFIGPTRLRDVEAAQQEVAAVAARILHARRSQLAVAR
jgi:flagellar motor switch protein FliG